METIGKYKVIKELGAGGFGAVYLAEDPRLGTQVAIKVFRVKDENLAGVVTSETGDPEAVLKARFHSEAKTLVGLVHNPHIVNLMEFDELPDGTPYYVMPFLPTSLENYIGKDVFITGKLAELAREQHPRKLAVSQALDILHQILQGMSEVHKAGLIHRDIKPANILFDSTGKVQICDFGIAKLPDSEHSTSGVGMGSRNYMSPEQRESAKHATPASDVYSIGVLAYRMLTGQLPGHPYDPPVQFCPELGQPLNDLTGRAIAQQEHLRPKDAGVMLTAFKKAITAMDDAGHGGDNNDNTVLDNEWLPPVKPELKPLQHKIKQLLTEQGEITQNDNIKLQALADVADMDEEALNAFIQMLQNQLSDKIRPLSNWLRSITRHQDKTRLDPVTENALREAGGSLGLTEAQITAHMQRKLPDTLLSEPLPENSAADTTKSNNIQTHRLQEETPTPERRSVHDISLIKQVQSQLKRLGHNLNENGQLDTRTRMEIRAFERDNGLRETGDIDSILTDKLALAFRAQDEKAWQQARQQNTVEAYAQYRQGYPDGRYCNEADNNAWNRLSEQVTDDLEPEKLNDYLQHFPDGRHIDAVGPLTKKIESQKEDQLLQQARRQDTVEAYAQYRQDYPNGQFINEVDNSAWERVRQDAMACLEPKILQGYKHNFPDGTYIDAIGPLTKEIELQKEDKVWQQAQQAGKTGFYRDYLEDYPEGHYTDEATKGFEKAFYTEYSAREYLKHYPQGQYAAQAKEAVRKQENRARLTERITKRLLVGAISIALVVGYQSYERSQQDDRAWRAAQQQNTPAVYKHFIRDYPDSEYIKLIESRLVITAFLDNMVDIPGGSFMMGSNEGRGNEKPMHSVTIEPFRLMAHEMTFAMWDACVAGGGCSHKPDDRGWGRSNRPVINVSWKDISNEFIPWLNRTTGEKFRLPTEAEWEYAARAGAATKYSWGNTISCSMAKYGNWDGVCGNDNNTVKVKSYQPNQFGLYDMHGNVWEWTQDCWNASYAGAPTDGSAWLQGNCDDAVLRGGSWKRHPDNLGSSSRSRNFRNTRNNNIGFRLARDLN